MEGPWQISSRETRTVFCWMPYWASHLAPQNGHSGLCVCVLWRQGLGQSPSSAAFLLCDPASRSLCPHLMLLPPQGRKFTQQILLYKKFFLPASMIWPLASHTQLGFFFFSETHGLWRRNSICHYLGPNLLKLRSFIRTHEYFLDITQDKFFKQIWIRLKEKKL